MAWAFARLDFSDKPWFDALASASLKTLTHSNSVVHERNIGMLVWAFSKISDLQSAWSILDVCKEAGRGLDGVSVSGLASVCERRGLYEDELRLLVTHIGAESQAMRCVALNAAAMSLAQVGAAPQGLLLLNSDVDSCSRVSNQILKACGAHGELRDSTFPQAGPRSAYSKELQMLAHVLSTATAGDADSVCDAIETFGSETLPVDRRWLKIAGGPKARLLSEAVHEAPCRGIILEIGTYCGYSAARMAGAHMQKMQHVKSEASHAWRGPRIVSIEVDAAHAAIARNVLAFAGLAHIVEVRTGHSEDVLPMLIPELQQALGEQQVIDVVFLDQRGSRYEADLKVIERFGALREGSVIVADNCLKPGAPRFLWRVVHGGEYDTEIVSLREFAMGQVEDWVSVSRRLDSADREGFQEDPPLAVRALEKKAEQMRTKTHRPDHGGDGVNFEEWAAFSASMRKGLMEVGFEATPAKLSIGSQGHESL